MADLDPNDPRRPVRFDDVKALAVSAPLFRSDAASLWFQKELEVTQAKQYEKRYPELSMASGALIPIRGTIPKGKKTGVYKTYGYTGVAKWMNTGSWKDIPLASAFGERKTYTVHEFAIGYGWELHELEESQANGVPLQQFEANAATLASDQFLNDKGLNGDVSKGIDGLTNIGNMTIIDAPAGAAGAHRWGTRGATSKSGVEMVADVALGKRTMRAVTNNVQSPNRCLMSSSFWERAQERNMGFGTDTSVLDYLRRIYSEIEFKEVREFESGGTYSGPFMMFLHVNSEDDLWLEAPLRREQHGPFQDGLRFGSIMRSSTGGVITPYPQAVLRMDFPAD